MAIVNRTPDSFYDRGATFAIDRALERAEEAISLGAAIVDIGGVKAGPGENVTAAEELDRVAPLIDALRRRHPRVTISVDTWRAEVAERAIAAGADLINDTWAGYDPELVEVAGHHHVGYVCSHTGGAEPRTRPYRVHYDDIVGDVIRETTRLAERAAAAGVPEDRVYIDPAHDFGKNTYHGLELLRRVDELVATGWPVLSWLGRFRPDPLRRLHLDLPALRGRGTGQQANPPAQVQRTALTGASGGVQAAQVSRAVRALSDDASRGLPAGWATAVRAASVSHADGLADALDHAVATTGLAMGRGRRWWGVVRIVQWFLFAVLVVGAGWMIINALLGGDLLPVPRWRQMPVPVLLMVGSALGGIVVAGLARLGVEVGARHRSADAQEALMLAVARVTDVAVIAPVESELERYEQARQAVATAKGEQ